MHFLGSFAVSFFNFLLACFAARAPLNRIQNQIHQTYTAPADERATRLRLAQFHSAKRNEM